MIGRPFGPVPVAEDWTFEAKGLYGTYLFTGPANVGLPYRTAGAVFDGRDIGNNGIEIREGEHQVVVHLAPIPARR
jgi:hypothetical protein